MVNEIKFQNEVIQSINALPIGSKVRFTNEFIQMCERGKMKITKHKNSVFTVVGYNITFNDYTNRAHCILRIVCDDVVLEIHENHLERI